MITTKRLGALALTGLVMVSLACSSTDDSATANTEASSPAAGSEVVITDAPAPVATEAPVVTAAPTTEAPAVTAAPTTEAPPATQAPTTTAAPSMVAPTIAPVAALMPDVLCMNLQDAQDLIQEQGVFWSNSQDATGAGRMQILDANWQVVNQFPATGTAIGEGDAMLDVVKYGEPTPCA